MFTPALLSTVATSASGPRGPNDVDHQGENHQSLGLSLTDEGGPERINDGQCRLCLCLGLAIGTRSATSRPLPSCQVRKPPPLLSIATLAEPL